MAAQAQQGLVDFAQKLEEEDLHVRMPDVVKTSSWKRQFKAHDKFKKRLMTGTEAAERDANTREQEATNQEKRSQALDSEASNSLLRRPIPPISSEDEEEKNGGEGEEEAALDEALMPPSLTSPCSHPHITQLI